MSNYVLSLEAQEDVFKIWSYLAEEASLETANRVEADIYEAFQLLSGTPGLGHKRSDLTEHPVLVLSSSPDLSPFGF